MVKTAERQQENEFEEKLVAINRVAKVVKGGRRFGFAALVVVGDGKGRVGSGHGKAKEVPDAIRKASEQAKRSLIRVPLKEGRTLHHDITASSGAGYVHMRSAPPGTGIIAGGPLRAIFEALGIHDVVAKSIGSSNPYNMVNATLKALEDIQNPRKVAERRGRKVSDIIAAREIEVGGGANDPGAGSSENETQENDVKAKEEKKPASKTKATKAKETGANAAKTSKVNQKKPKKDQDAPGNPKASEEKGQEK